MSKDELSLVESEKFEDWSKRLLEESEEVGDLAIEALGDETKGEAEKQLRHFQRQGKLPKNRPVHMHQDVIIISSRKTKRVKVGGGKMTGTLWHIINDGAYRTFATHFIDATLNVIDNKADEIIDMAARKVGLDL